MILLAFQMPYERHRWWCCSVCRLSMLLLAAEAAVREMLCEFAAGRALPEVGTVKAEDQLDDGSTIALTITIDRWGLALAMHSCIRVL